MAPHIEAEGNETEADEAHIETDVVCNTNKLEVVEVKADPEALTVCLYQGDTTTQTEEIDNLDEIIPDQDDPHSVSDDDNCDYYDHNNSANHNSDPDDLNKASQDGDSTEDDFADDDSTDTESTDDDSYDSTDDDPTDDDLDDNHHHLPWNFQSEVHTSDNFFKTPQNKLTERAEEEVKKLEVKGQRPEMYKYDSSDWQVDDYYYDNDEDGDQSNAAATTPKTQSVKCQDTPLRTELEPVPALNKEDFTDPLGGQTVLGRGAFGEVTLKYQESAGRWVAYKSLNEGSRDDIVLEAQMMQLLGNHPSFPAIYGVVIQDGHLALVSEFLGDELTSRPLSLTDALQGERPLQLSQEEWNDIAHDIVDGVWYMHRCNLLHHDIKTDNILLVDGATHWEARIIDFGQCKQSKEQLVAPLDANINPHEKMMAARLHWTIFSDIYGVGKILLLIGQHGNVPSLEEGGLSLKKSANLSKESTDDVKYPQMEIVRFELRKKSRKMWN